MNGYNTFFNDDKTIDQVAQNVFVYIIILLSAHLYH